MGVGPRTLPHLTFVRLVGRPALLARSSAAEDVELLVLRHEVRARPVTTSFDVVLTDAGKAGQARHGDISRSADDGFSSGTGILDEHHHAA